MKSLEKARRESLELACRGRIKSMEGAEQSAESKDSTNRADIVGTIWKQQTENRETRPR